MSATTNQTFEEFYRFYLGEHSRPGTRRLHFLGTVLTPVLLIAAVATGWWWLVLVAVGQAYACAWGSHLLIEGNKPVSFGHPVLCAIADWRMVWEMVTGRIAF